MICSRDDAQPPRQPPMCRHSGIARRFLLLLAGDVLPNPGPIQHPCAVCCKCVRSNQRALQCDKCQLWSHIKCVGIVDSVYRELQAKDAFSWQCPLCLFAELPATEVIDCDVQSSEESVDEDALPLTVEVLGEAFHGFRVLHHNVQGFHSKMDELSLAMVFQLC